MSRRTTHIGASAIVLACALAATLLTAGPASARSTGFDIYNLTSTPMEVTDVSTAGSGGFEHGVSPSVGDALMPAQPPLHVELDYFLTADTFAYLTYQVPGNTGPNNASISVSLSSHSDSRTRCDSNRTTFQCIVNGGVITILDPPGTVHTVSAGNKQEQADMIRLLCKDTSSAKCTFTPRTPSKDEPAKVLTQRHVVGDTLTNCGPQAHTETKVERSDKVGFTNGVDVEIGASTEFNVFGQKVKASIKLAYHHETINEHEFKQDVTLNVNKGDIGWVASTQPVLRYTGDYKLEVGNTTWNLKGVYFDDPDARKEAPLGGFVTDGRKLTDAELDSVCTHKETGLTQAPARFVQLQSKGTDGHDLLLPGPESHTVLGSAGNDLVRGGKGHDTLNGGRDHDALSGGRGRDTLNGGRGHDVLDGGPGRDTLNGGPGADTIIDNGGPTLVQTGAGTDTVNVRDGRNDDTVICGSRRSTVLVDAGDSVIGRCGMVSRSGPN
jgi:hypothetical protein